MEMYSVLSRVQLERGLFQTWRIVFSDVGEPISVKKIKMMLPRCARFSHRRSHIIYYY